MGEIDPKTFHRREARRFLKLAELTPNVALKQRLMNTVQFHRRTANSLDALGGSEATQGWTFPPSGHRESTPYCLHLVNGPHPACIQELSADNDGTAIAIAFALHDACSDFFPHFELRQGTRVLVRSEDRRGPKRPADLNKLRARVQKKSVLQIAANDVVGPVHAKPMPIMPPFAAVGPSGQ